MALKFKGVKMTNHPGHYRVKAMERIIEIVENINIPFDCGDCDIENALAEIKEIALSFKETGDPSITIDLTRDGKTDEV